MKRIINSCRVSRLILLFLLFWLPTFLLSQQRNVTLQRIDVSEIPEIHLYFSVTDETGNSILGLTEAEIQLAVDGAPQIISSLKSALEGREFLAVALLFDRSGSMKKALDQTKDAAINFVKRMSVDDQIAVISFDDIVRVDSNFSKDRAITENAIKAIDLGKDTALYDAIEKALSLLKNTQTKRQAIVTLSDGKDTKSKLLKEEILLEAKNNGIPLFTLGLGANIDENSLIELSNETGGSFFKAATPDDLLLLYQTIAEQLKNQYVLSFKLTFGMDEKWHDLKIMFKDPQGKEYASTREFIASKGPGVSRETMAGFERKIERRNILSILAIGAFIGLGFGLLLLLFIRLARPEVAIISLTAFGLVLSTMILGAIISFLIISLL